MVTIYALCDGRVADLDARVRYVGQTRLSVEARLRRHWVTALAGAREHRAAWMRAVRGAGGDVLAVVLDRVPAADADAAEVAHIAMVRARGGDLTNRTDGGKGHSGEVSLETRLKMSASAKRRGPHAPEVYRRAGESIRKSVRHRAHLRRLHAMNRRPCAPSTRERIRAALVGEGNGQNVLTWAEVDRIRDQYASGVRQVDLVREYKVSPATVHRVVHNNGWVRP